MTLQKRSTTIIRSTLLFLGALLYLIPFIYALYTSLLSKANVGSLVGPSHWVLENYRYVINAGLFGWYKNSLIMTGGIIVGNIILNTMAGYALARIEFPGKQVIFFIIIGTMMISGQITVVPIYIMCVKLGWVNTYKALIIPFLTNGMLTFFMRQFFLSIPLELEESAHIDGLGRFGMFIRIVLPISKMSLATQIIFLFREWWNQLLWPVTLTNKLEMFVITVGLNSLKGQYYEWMNVSMTGVVCAILPVILLFILMQRQFTQSLALVGIKG